MSREHAQAASAVRPREAEVEEWNGVLEVFQPDDADAAVIVRVEPERVVLVVVPGTVGDRAQRPRR